MKKLVVIALLSILLSACSGLPEDKAIETMVRDSITERWPKADNRQ